MLGDHVTVAAGATIALQAVQPAIEECDEASDDGGTRFAIAAVVSLFATSSPCG
jgi:hypothetical protein